jgi:hypothetical protein
MFLLPLFLTEFDGNEGSILVNTMGKRPFISPRLDEFVSLRPKSPLTTALTTPSSTSHPALRDITNSARADPEMAEPSSKRVALRRSSSRIKARTASKLATNVFPSSRSPASENDLRDVENPVSKLAETDNDTALKMPKGRSALVPDLDFQIDLDFSRLHSDKAVHVDEADAPGPVETVDEILKTKLTIDSQP